MSLSKVEPIVDNKHLVKIPTKSKPMVIIMHADKHNVFRPILSVSIVPDIAQTSAHELRTIV